MITKQRIFCHEKAKCVNLEGKAQCHCNNGFTGDGIDQCIPETLPSKLRLNSFKGFQMRLLISIYKICEKKVDVYMFLETSGTAAIKFQNSTNLSK